MSFSPLRQRMVGDMTARHIGEGTQRNYIRCVKSFAAFMGRPLETATAEDLRLYRLHLVERRHRCGRCDRGTRRLLPSLSARANGSSAPIGFRRPSTPIAEPPEQLRAASSTSRDTSRRAKSGRHGRGKDPPAKGSQPVRLQCGGIARDKRRLCNVRRHLRRLRCR